MKKNPESIRTPAGLEWKLMQRLPRLTLIGLLALLALWALVQVWPFGGDPGKVGHNLRIFDFVMIGLASFHLTMALTVALGCFIVMVMKGPQYTSDSYPVQDAEQPQP